jgi:hypothetical protein
VEKVLIDGVASAPAGAEAATLPERVQVAFGELAGAAKEGLLALSVGRQARRPQRADGGGCRRGRRPEWQARPRPHGRASRP